MLNRTPLLIAAPAAALTGAMLIALPDAPVLAQSGGANCVGKVKHGMWLNVIAEGLRNSDGKLVVTVYPDSKRDFLAANGELNVGKVNAHTGETQACVFIPEAGVYAIAVYHDEDGDGKFDRNPLPTEGYGFSNNPPTFFSLPKFQATRVSVPRNNMTVRIKMNYRT